ncbi:MAG: ABC transporter permease [Thermoanaerobaculia bacterium]|nr:MAG: ABC transporter permease [Thermoanaerobaculia bacterium]MBZ0102396.1 ABC transporter permease [Thermoanaerobaculia bacterium]
MNPMPSRTATPGGTPVASLALERAPLPLGRVIGAYWAEAKYETIAALRNPGFAIPFLLVPVAIYLLFAVVIAGNAGATSEFGPELADYLFSGFSVLAAVMPGIFASSILAAERDGNLLKLKRALPLPPGATIVAKVAMSMVIAAMAVALVAVAALAAGKITLSLGQVAAMVATLVLGTIPFAAIGLLLGTLVSGSAAPAWGNLVFLPQIWLSGLFIPLPDSLERFVIVWPTFHLNQVVLAAGGVEKFQFLPPAIAAAVLAGVTVLCGGFAIRRLARVG